MTPYRTPGKVRPGPGGTSGGGYTFLIGLVMVIAGGYLFLDNVSVTSNFGRLYDGQNGAQGTFGLSLIPIFAGIIILFFNGKSQLGRLLTGGGMVIICAGVIRRLTIHFREISLFDMLLILVLLAGGIGLIARSLRDHGKPTL
jgi:hypothetical protein